MISGDTSCDTSVSNNQLIGAILRTFAKIVFQCVTVHIFHSFQTLTMARRFEFEDTITRRYSRFNAMGTQLVVRLLPVSNARDPVSHSLTKVNDLFRHTLQNLSDSDMFGITIQNRVHQKAKSIGISFRHKDQLLGDFIWSLVEKVSQSNSRFNALEKLVTAVHSVRMTVGFGKRAIKTRAANSQSWHNL